MALETTLLVIGVIILATALFTLIIAFSARKIDFGERIFRPGKRQKIVDRPVSRDSRKMLARPPPAPSPVAASESYDKKKAKSAGLSRRAKKEEKPTFLGDIEPLEKERARSDEFSITEDALAGPGQPVPKVKDEEFDEEMKSGILGEEAEEIVSESINVAVEAESLYLQYQTAMRELRVKEAQEFLSNAKIIAEQNNLEQLLEKISSEEERISESLDGWEIPTEELPTITEEAELPIVDEDIEGTKFSRDLSIKLPKNMCLEEVFRMKITLIKAEEFDEDVTISDLELDKKEAKYFSLNVTKLGETVVEATTRIKGLEEGSLIVRPISIGNVTAIAPAQRTVHFNPDQTEIVVEFFLTPIRWTTDVVNVMRVEFEQNYEIIKTVNIPVKIYKRKLEAMFGLNLSKWHQYTLFIYSAIGTILGLIGTLQDKLIPAISNWFA